MFLGGGNEHFCDWRFFVRFVGEKVFLFGTVAVGANFGLPRTLGFKSGPFVVLRAREREREREERFTYQGLQHPQPVSE